MTLNSKHDSKLDILMGFISGQVVTRIWLTSVSFPILAKIFACNLLKQKVWYFYQSLSKSKCQIVKLISTVRTSPKYCHFGNGKITFKGQNKPTSCTEPTWKICNWTQWTASVIWYFSYQVQFSIFRITEHLSLWASGQISPVNYNGNLEVKTLTVHILNKGLYHRTLN